MKSKAAAKLNARSFLDRFYLKNQVVLITGAGGQLGAQFGKTLGQAGAKVLIADVDLSKGKALVNQLKAMGIDAHAIRLDVANPQSVKKAFALIAKRYNRLDVLVNAAAIAVFSPFEKRSYKDFMRVMEVNVGGVFLCSQAAARLMRRAKTGGRIINIGSIYGVVSSDPKIYVDCERRNSEVYSASKAAVLMLTRYLAVHLAPDHIRVNAISPGGVYRDHQKAFTENYSKRTPLGRMAREDELNHALLYLASEASSYVTGHNLMIDGGLSAW